ncbi:Na/Pi symporter [Bacillus sp. B15-48]|uniref:Na/Pi cotransporter family protein n=1 Tax=Bacillus sp. B15-48 TaxID=1548601 RepID=UPI0031B88D11
MIGGIGLFLLGMNMLTDGLKELAGGLLKKWLNRFTGGRVRSILSGALITALIQSSSATTILTIGFVSAGLLTFMQSIGVIIGANIGTTSTSWIVSLIGFKVDLQAMSLPFIGGGILLTFAPGRYKPYGTVVAGFGLLFLGIEFLQAGMNGLENMFMFNSISGETFPHKLLLILIGLVMTVVMQSSSAAIATTLTMLHAGAIGFEQTAFLVIGQTIGTTVTAVLAAIGASIPAKRTALTHVVFNIITGGIAFLIAPLLLTLTVTIGTSLNGEFDATLGIAIFHTLFKIIGALLFLPFLRPFANLVLKMVPDKGNALTSYLDPNVATVPSVAIDAAYKTLVKMMRELSGAIVLLMETKRANGIYEQKILHVEEAIATTRRFLDSIQSTNPELHHKHLAVVHALDHIERLTRVLKDEQKEKAVQLQEKLISEWYGVLLHNESSMGHEEKIVEFASSLAETSATIADERRERRHRYFERSVKNETELETSVEKVEALLWVDRLAYHYWRTIARMAEYVK